MPLHTEINFEDEIGHYMADHGWHYSPSDDGYDRARALFPEDVIAWVQATQPAEWAAIEKNHGAAAPATLLDRLRASLDQQRGTLDVLRHGIELLGLRGKLALAQFKPALAMNPDILARYARCCPRVQVEVLCEPSLRAAERFDGGARRTTRRPTLHVVRRGESIWTIARRNNMDPKTLMRMNLFMACYKKPTAQS